MIYLLVIFIGIGIIYGLYEYTHIKVIEENIFLEVKKDMRIVFISDLQYDASFGFNKKMLEKLVNQVNKLNPDILIFGGDIIHSKNKFNNDIFEKLKELKAKYKIAILGNHDYYNLEEVINFYGTNGINLLKNSEIEINGLKIYGVDDFREGIPKIPLKKYDIVLSHNPDFVEKIPPNLVTYVLSGHFHAGQITFFNYSPAVTSLYGQKYRYGWVQKDDISVYVSSGIGGWVGPLPIRINAKPEIVVWNIKKSEI